VAVIALTGLAGTGKTALATWWLRQVRGNYPGGQLFARLGGHLPGAPVPPGEVLGQFLRALGMPPTRPDDVEELTGMWRSATTARRLIVMLDNATTAAQVRALLPAGGPSLVVVTSRHTLNALALDGAHFTRLGPLDEHAAVEQLGLVLGDGRAAAEPDAARAVVQLCGCLPLAVCVIAARHALSPQRTVAEMAAELASEPHRLAALSLDGDGDLSVPAAFDGSYQALGTDVARMYRLASLLPAPEFSAELAAAATATGPRHAAGLLDALVDASLLEEPATRSYRFHPLVRLHARGYADTHLADERQAMITRSAGWFLHAAVAACAADTSPGLLRADGAAWSASIGHIHASDGPALPRELNSTGRQMSLTDSMW